MVYKKVVLVLKKWSWSDHSWSWKNKWSWSCNLVVLLHTGCKMTSLRS